MADMQAAMTGKLGIDTTSPETIAAAIRAELGEIAHLAETSTVASDLAVLRARALPLLGWLAQFGQGAAEAWKPEADKLGAGFSVVKEAVDQLWQMHGELAAKHDELAAHVTAPAAPPPPAPAEPPHGA